MSGFEEKTPPPEPLEGELGSTQPAMMRAPVLRHAVKAEPKMPCRPQDGTEIETSFETLATALGFQAARQMTGRYGGRRIYLPDRLSRTHPLSRLMGWPAARAACAKFGPGWIAVPLGPNATALQRRQKVQMMSEAGYTVAAIAKRLKVHTRTVERHRAILKAEADAVERLEREEREEQQEGRNTESRSGVKLSEMNKAVENLYENTCENKG